jgi:tRNA(fMet)-specific endonuclease VapC
MSLYLLDTNHASDIFRHRAGLTEKLRAHPNDRFGIPAPSVGELWYMVFNSARVAENTKRLYEVLSDFLLVDYDEQAVIEFGRLKAELRRSGTMIGDVDIQIAAIARSQGLVLLTGDAHFGYVSGLQTENWI